MGLESLISVLRKLGLTEYEAKAYITLVKLGSADARTIAEASGVPRTRIYDVLHSLEVQNLVQVVSAGRPANYAPLPLEASLEERKRRLLKEVEDGIKALEAYYREGLQDKFNAWVVRGEERTYQAALKLVKEASQRLIFHCASLPPKIFRLLVKALRQAEGRGVKIHVVVDPALKEAVGSRSFEGFLERFKPKVEGFPLPLNLVVSDFREILIFYAPTAGQLESSEPVGLRVHTGRLRKLLEDRFGKIIELKGG